MSTDGILPAGVVNADPAGGWESGNVADRETEALNVDAIDSPSLSDSGLPPSGADGGVDAPGSVEGTAAGQNADPDLITDDDLDEENS